MGAWPTLEPLWLSLRVATLSTLLVVAFGLPAALLLARSRSIWSALCAGLLTLPLVLPPTVVGYVLLLTLGRRGWIGAWIERVSGFSVAFHWTGAVIASTVTAFPLFLLPARSAFEGVDRRLEDAARLLGRRERSVFASITLPLAWRGLAAGALLAFTRALGDFGATLMLAGDMPGRTRTLPLAIFDAVNNDDTPAALTYASLVSAVAIVVLIIVQRRLAPRSAA